MPEIFTLLNNSHAFKTDYIKEQYEKGIRPPVLDYKIKSVMIKAIFGGRTFHGVSPFVSVNDVVVVCDGTIYNSKKLFDELGIEPTTDHDYEIIVHLYLRYGIDVTLQMLDGVFAFALLDHRMKTANGDMDSILYIARDPYGAKPLYLLRPNTKNIMIEYMKTDGDIYGVASNVEMLKGFEQALNVIDHPDNDVLLVKGKPKKPFYVVEPVIPGTYSIFEQKFRVMATWRFIKHENPYYTFPLHSPSTISTNEILINAVTKRIRDKPISIVFSGNYEGFMTAAIVAHQLQEQDKKVNTFAWTDIEGGDIGQVVEYIGSHHTEVAITEADIQNEKENINVALAGTLETAAFHRFWWMAKKIAEMAPESVVFLETGMDTACQPGTTTQPQLDVQYKLQTHFKTICTGWLNTVSKIFWYHGLEVEIPWLDQAVVQDIVTQYSKDSHLTFNPVGIYGNKMLPEELF